MSANPAAIRSVLEQLVAFHDQRIAETSGDIQRLWKIRVRPLRKQLELIKVDPRFNSDDHWLIMEKFPANVIHTQDAMASIKAREEGKIVWHVNTQQCVLCKMGIEHDKPVGEDDIPVSTPINGVVGQGTGGSDCQGDVGVQLSDTRRGETGHLSPPTEDGK